MPAGLRELDDLLRGRLTGHDQLTEGELKLSLRLFVPLAVGLGAAYGFCMGVYALTSRTPPNYWQVVASTLKLPALFLLTLVVTFPSLYVFNALLGCRLGFVATLRLLVAAIVVNLAVAASLGPILAFFTLSTTSYAFMVIFNVVLLGVGGVVGLGFLMQALRRVAAPPYEWQAVHVSGAPPRDVADRPAAVDRGSLERISEDYPTADLGSARGIFRIWIVIYGMVGTQMGWLLRPFIGSPDLPFAWFRARDGNFFQAIVQQLQNLLGIAP